MQYAFLRGEAILVLTLDQTNIFYKFHHLVPFYKSLHIFEEKKRNSRSKNKKYREITIYVYM